MADDTDKWAKLRTYLQQHPADMEEVTGEEPDEEKPDEEKPEEASGPGLADRAGAALDAIIPDQAAAKLAKAPTPGGLFPLVVAILFFLFAIVPVHPSGATRLQLMWRALTGGATLPSSDAHQADVTDAFQQAAAAVHQAEQGIATANAFLPAIESGIISFWENTGL